VVAAAAAAAAVAVAVLEICSIFPTSTDQFHTSFGVN